MLNKLFSYLGLSDLPWKKMDEDCFDEVVIGNDHYKFPQGYDNYEKRLIEYFPHQEENIKKFVEMLRRVGEGIGRSFDPRTTDDVYVNSLFAKSAYEYMHETISDERLIDVISASAGMKMELNAEKLPLYTFAQINSQFVQSAYRITGGGMQIAEKLKEQIESLGGKVARNAEVTSLREVDGKIDSIVINGNEQKAVKADIFISDIHPAATLNLLAESKMIRNIYRKRINSLENTFGIFTVNIALKPNTIKYQNKNIFAYKHDGIWQLHENAGDKGVEAIMINFQPPTDGSEFTQNIDILTPMKWNKVELWNGTEIGKRGNDYEAVKADMAKKCIDFAASNIEGLSDAIDAVYTSTPLTYSDYIATVNGSAFGIRKDYKKLMYTLLTPRTPVPNLLLTGQSLNLHGILGVSMTSIFTCAEVFGMQTVTESLNNE